MTPVKHVYEAFSTDEISKAIVDYLQDTYVGNFINDIDEGVLIEDVEFYATGSPIYNQDGDEVTQNIRATFNWKEPAQCCDIPHRESGSSSLVAYYAIGNNFVAVDRLDIDFGQIDGSDTY